MGNSSVVSIRVEALGVSITIAGGSIAIEQTKAETPAAAMSKPEASAVVIEPTRPGKSIQEETRSQEVGDLSREIAMNRLSPVIDEFHRPSPPGSNGPAELSADGNPVVPASGEGREAQSSQTKTGMER